MEIYNIIYYIIYIKKIYIYLRYYIIYIKQSDGEVPVMLELL